jgi:hypothetical protein
MNESLNKAIDKAKEIINKAKETGKPVVDPSGEAIYFPLGFGIDIDQLGDLFEKDSPEMFALMLDAILVEYTRMLTFATQLPDNQKINFGLSLDTIDHLYRLSNYLQCMQIAW